QDCSNIGAVDDQAEFAAGVVEPINELCSTRWLGKLAECGVKLLCVEGVAAVLIPLTKFAEQERGYFLKSQCTVLVGIGPGENVLGHLSVGCHQLIGRDFNCNSIDQARSTQPAWRRSRE